VDEPTEVLRRILHSFCYIGFENYAKKIRDDIVAKFYNSSDVPEVLKAENFPRDVTDRGLQVLDLEIQFRQK
jgi:hypothetical protein